MEALLPMEVWLPIKTTLLTTKRFDLRLLSKLGVNLADFEQKKSEILAEYERKRNDACIKGTLAHEKKELSFYNKNQFDFGKYGYKDLKGEFECRENYYKLDLQNGVYPEFLIQWQSDDGELMLAGISDLVVVHGTDLYIID